MSSSIATAELTASEPGVSRYASLASALRARILAGEWQAGAALPAEQQLAAQHRVALGTMRRALELLVEQGLIERIHGRGTFVRQGLGGAPMLRFFRFGDAGEVPQSRILSREALPASVAVAAQLDAAPGTPCLRLKRLRVLDGQPRLHEEIWLPLPQFAPLAKSDPESWPPLLYPLYGAACGVHVHRARDEIGFGTFTGAQARQLGLEAGHPCAVVTRTAYDLHGRPVEARVSRGDAHAFHYTVTIT